MGKRVIFQGEREGCYLCVEESMAHAPKMLNFEDWNLIENHYPRNTRNATK